MNVARIIGAMAFLAASSAAVPAFARPTLFFSCNIDGFIHITIVYPNEPGLVGDVKTDRTCGPALRAPGDTIAVVIAHEGRIPTGAREFLAHIERGRAGVVVRSPVQNRGPVSRTEPAMTIYLNPRQVGRNLATYLSAVDPRWRDLPEPEVASQAQQTTQQQAAPRAGPTARSQVWDGGPGGQEGCTPGAPGLPGLPGRPGGTSPTCAQAIGDTTVVNRVRCSFLDSIPNPDPMPILCIPQHVSTSTCTASGGTVEQADGQTGCRLPSANVARFRSAVARQSAGDARRRGGPAPRN